MLKGTIFILLSALAFAISTVFVKIVTLQSDMPTLQITSFRFFLSFLIMLTYVIIKRKPLRPHKVTYVVLRAILNLGAVFFLFLGIKLSTVTKANMLNMTYPVFVFIVAPFINREKAKSSNYFFLFMTMIGVYLVTSPNIATFNIGDVYALCSSVIGGLAISVLREARKHDEGYLILFYLMAIGAGIGLFITIPIFMLPETHILLPLVLSGLSGFSGQIFTTMGFRYIDAPRGSLVAASRILFAGILGVSLFADPLTPKILLEGRVSRFH